MTGDDRFDALLRSSGTGMEKLAVSKMDFLREGVRGVSRSALGSHGVAGWAPMLKHPLKSVWRGVTNMPWWMMPLQAGTAMNLYGDVTDKNKGVFERAGAVAGTIAPFGLAGLGHKGPGHIGSMLGQEALGGRGMVFKEGLLPKAGRKLDELLHLNKKPAQNQQQQPAQAGPRNWGKERIMGTLNTAGAVTGIVPPDFDWRKVQ